MVFFLLPQKLLVRFKYDQKRERERETGHQHFLPGMSEIKGYFILFLSTKFEIPSPLIFPSISTFHFSVMMFRISQKKTR